MRKFYQVAKVAELFRVFYGLSAANRAEVRFPEGTRVFHNATTAKQQTWFHFKQMPVYTYGDEEVAYDLREPLHRALQSIEDRNKGHSIVAVGKTHYLIRRGKFNTEVRVKYTNDAGYVNARDDQEPMR